jgi:protein farnesyltransferase/geranylgeranyltransferase type-1 subunit alpha
LEIEFLDEKIIKRIEKIIENENYTEENLNATSVALRTNPHNYNFWIIHRKILKAFKFNPYKELLWIEELILETPKNFLCWNHRKIIVESSPTCTKASTELKLTERIIKQNPKNYFAYAHRQFAINKFKFENLGLLTEEMRFSAELINEDIRNNSAWNQRFELNVKIF